MCAGGNGETKAPSGRGAQREEGRKTAVGRKDGPSAGEASRRARDAERRYKWWGREAQQPWEAVGRKETNGSDTHSGRSKKEEAREKREGEGETLRLRRSGLRETESVCVCVCMCVCVCVCGIYIQMIKGERERERERKDGERKNETVSLFFLPSLPLPLPLPLCLFYSLPRPSAAPLRLPIAHKKAVDRERRLCVANGLGQLSRRPAHGQPSRTSRKRERSKGQERRGERGESSARETERDRGREGRR